MRLLIALLLAPLVLQAQFTPQEYGARRDALASMLGDGVVVVLGAREPVHDYLEFDQNPAMLYLSGIREPNAALVMVRRGGRTGGTVFVSRRVPAAEIWSGTRLGLEGAQRVSGLAARENGELRHVLDSLAAVGLPLFTLGEFSGGRDSLARTPHDQLVQALRQRHPQLRVSRADAQLDQLRGRKSPAELALLRRAVEITVEAHQQAAKAVRPGMHEYEIEALVEYVFRRNGAERPAFASIIGSGPNSTTLHYNVNDRKMLAGETVVMDIGASYQGYAADVTRTLPVSGTFSPEQREIYTIVRQAQAAAETAARPGASWQDVENAATSAIASGLARIGLIESATASFDAGAHGTMPQYSLFYMHGLGHGIGLEVHDPEQFYFTRTVAEGSAFTIEPGIYVRADVLDHLPDTPRNRALVAKLRPVVERFRNVGVRIEDDYIVTEKGTEWISRAPREIQEIETLMRKPVP